MKRTTALTFILALLAAGCASTPKPKDAAAQSGPPNVAAEALAAQKKKEAKEHPGVKIGSDAIVEQDAAAIWPLIIKVEDWGSWMTKVTKVEPGAGLSPGAIIKWQWDEKPIESEIVSVKENEEFAYKTCASSKKAIVKWTLKSIDPKHTLISLRAEVPYGTADEITAKVSAEMLEWLGAIQVAAGKLKPADEEE